MFKGIRTSSQLIKNNWGNINMKDQAKATSDDTSVTLNTPSIQILVSKHRFPPQGTSFKQ